MANPEIEQAFGELRSMIHRGEQISAREWIAFLMGHREQDPERYDQVWLPYLRQANLPTFKVASVERTRDLLACLPDGIKLRFVAPLEYTDFEAFLDSPQITKITELDLSRSNVGNQGAFALANSVLGDTLRALDLSFNEIGANGVAALVDEREYPLLERLVLSDNDLDNLAASIIAERLIAPKLAWLDLARNRIGPVGEEYLRGSSRLENVFLIH